MRELVTRVTTIRRRLDQERKQDLSEEDLRILKEYQVVKTNKKDILLRNGRILLPEDPKLF